MLVSCVFFDDDTLLFRASARFGTRGGLSNARVRVFGEANRGVTRVSCLRAESRRVR